MHIHLVCDDGYGGGKSLIVVARWLLGVAYSRGKHILLLFLLCGACLLTLNDFCVAKFYQVNLSECCEAKLI
jgi:hypothetical protein